MPPVPRTADKPTGPFHRAVCSGRTLINLVIALGFLAFLATRIEVDSAHVAHVFAGASMWLYAAALGVYYVSFAFRGARWKLMLNETNGSEGRGSDVGSLQCAHFILVGWFVNAIAPFRLGDAYRGYLVTQRYQISFARASGSLVTERFLDVALIFLLLSSAIGLGFSAVALEIYGYLWGITLIIVAAGGAALLLLWRFGQRSAFLLPARMNRFYQGFRRGTRIRLSQLPALTALGVLGWICEIGRLYLVVQALGVDLPLSTIIVVAMAHSLLTSVPLTPGGIGFSEAGMTALLIVQLPASESVAIALLDRGITYASILAAGGAAFLLLEARRLTGRTP